MTNTFILICFAVWVYIIFINKEDRTDTALKLGAFYPPYVKKHNEYWRFITCNFIHISFLHFSINARTLYYLGNFFESGLGILPYLFLVLVSMVFSAMMCLTAADLSENHYFTVTIGASGIVYGFFGMIVAMGLLNSGSYGSLLDRYISDIVVNVVYTFLNNEVSKSGHLGGFIGGVFCAVIFMVIGVL